MPKPRASRGVAYGPGVTGKYQFRVRELHVAENYVPLLKAKKLGAVKLDLVLRGVALLPKHAGNREPGLVLPDISYQSLHDICRPPSHFSMRLPEDEIDDRQILRLKRNWVGKQLGVLEQAGALRRVSGNRGRPRIIVQRDHGTGPFDDPDGTEGNSYITISGPIIAQWLKFWGTPEVSAYLAAMVADRYARLKNPGHFPRGGAIWFETLDWFADPHGYRPQGRCGRTDRLHLPHPPTRPSEPTHRQPRASVTSGVVRSFRMDQPTTRLDQTSMTAASHLGTPHHTTRQARPPIPIRPTQHLHQPLRPSRRSGDSTLSPRAAGSAA